ncbi:MAG TPA: asparagine synthase-related protein [Gaiellaceae bacterium]|nr:asparagine synthase-related protein [Gaiellaceae bacterium]
MRSPLAGAFGSLAAGEEGLELAGRGREDSFPGVVVALEGRIENASELARELGLGEREAPERVLAAAFARWRSGMLERLRGRFALALWDHESTSGVLAVDRLAARALFFCEEDGRLLFASELRPLLGLLSRRPAPDRAAVAHWIAQGLLERGQTLYDGVRRLEGGHFLALERDGWTKGCYWRPRYQPPQRLPPQAAAAEVRRAVTGAVASRLLGARAGVLLSGGIDSASVAAVATGESATGALRAYSALFPEHPSADEGPLVESLTKELGLAGAKLLFRGGSMLAPSLEFLRESEAPSSSPNLHFQLPLLRQAADDGVATLLDGQGGDELFGCAPYLLADRLRQGNLAASLSLARSFPGAGLHPSARLVSRLLREYALKGVLPHGVHGLAPRLRGAERYAPPWLRAESARLHVETSGRWAWKHLSGPRWWAHLAYTLTIERERIGVYDFLRRKCALAGIEGAHPFLDDVELVEFVLGLPPEPAFDPELDRSLLRDAMTGLVPDRIRLRREKSYFNELFVDCVSRTDRPAIERLLSAPDAEVNAYVRPEIVRGTLLEAPAQRRGPAWAWALWRLATIECWLRFQSDPDFPERALDTWGFEKPRYALELAGG